MSLYTGQMRFMKAVRQCFGGTAHVEKEHQFLMAVTDAMGEGVYVLDVDGNCVFLNPEAEARLGWAEGELIGRNLHSIIHFQDSEGQHVPTHACPTLQSIQQGQTFRSDNDTFTRKDGTMFPVSIVSVPIREGNKVVGSVAVFHDITKRLENARALAAARDAAEMASKAKSEFLANMSHELRTPLNAIIGFGEFLHLHPEEKLSERQSEYVSHMVNSGKHLLALVNGVLDVAKIEAGQEDLKPEEVHLSDIISRCVDLCLPTADRKNISIVGNWGAAKDIVAYADPKGMTQVLLNLISNATKYNQDSGTISIAVAREDKRIARVTVSDTGVGISHELRERVFAPFDRLGVDGADRIEGTGVGLTVTKGLVEKMGGEIDFHSEVGRGTSFWFTVPTLCCSS